MTAPKDHNSLWIDVTVSVSDGMVHWPGDIRVEVTQTSSIKNGAAANVTSISMSVHTATHIDAQKHFINGGKDITQIPLGELIGRVKVFRINDQHCITLDEIKSFPILRADRIIFKTHNSDEEWSHMPFRENYVYLATDAALYLRDQGIRCIGVDYLSVAGNDNAQEVHQALLENEIVIIEGLDLWHIDEGEYEMICLPLKIKHADGAPARVLLKPLDKQDEKNNRNNRAW